MTTEVYMDSRAISWINGRKSNKKIVRHQVTLSDSGCPELKTC